MEAVYPIRAHWQSFGIALGIPHGTIQAVDRNNRNVDDCLRQILSEWLKRNYNVERHGEPTVAKLCKEVASRSGGQDKALAERVETECKDM